VFLWVHWNCNKMKLLWYDLWCMVWFLCYIIFLPRLHQWLTNIQRLDLLDLPPTRLSNIKVCMVHFDNELWNDPNNTRSRLQPDVCPTVNLPIPTPTPTTAAATAPVAASATTATQTEVIGTVSPLVAAKHTISNLHRHNRSSKRLIKALKQKLQRFVHFVY
jgi:hypothetical protein